MRLLFHRKKYCISLDQFESNTCHAGGNSVSVNIENFLSIYSCTKFLGQKLLWKYLEWPQIIWLSLHIDLLLNFLYAIFRSDDSNIPLPSLELKNLEPSEGILQALHPGTAFLFEVVTPSLALSQSKTGVLAVHSTNRLRISKSCGISLVPHPRRCSFFPPSHFKRQGEVVLFLRGFWFLPYENLRSGYLLE